MFSPGYINQAEESKSSNKNLHLFTPTLSSSFSSFSFIICSLLSLNLYLIPFKYKCFSASPCKQHTALTSKYPQALSCGLPLSAHCLCVCVCETSWEHTHNNFNDLISVSWECILLSSLIHSPCCAECV